MPNNNPNYKRFNPICNEPKVIIQNTGSDTLLNIQIQYGTAGNTNYTYNWTGKLGFEQMDM